MHKRYYLQNEDNGNLLYISKTDIGDSFVTTYHSHTNLEILLITEGEGKLITPEKTFNFKEQDIVIINTNTSHRESTNKYCKFYAIGILNSNAYKNNDFNHKIIVSSFNDLEYMKLLSLFRVIYDESKNFNDSELTSSCFKNIVKIIERNDEIMLDENELEETSTLVANAKNIIDNYHYSNFQIDELANRLSVSTSTLCHQFKKETGMSIIDYRVKIQIDEACNLLKITDMKIIDISDEVGFSSSSYFTKIFKKIMHIGPKEYRQKFTKN